MIECTFINCGFEWLRVRVPLQSTLDIAPVSSKEMLDIQATTECRFTLKRVCDNDKNTVIKLVIENENENNDEVCVDFVILFLL